MNRIQPCCRLCLAPDSECVSIFGTRAADKQSISKKIQACVNIQVTESDRLSGRICHGCISYLNSWTSFKGRCVAAQKRQMTWLANGGQNGGQKQLEEDDQDAYNYYPQYHKKGGRDPSHNESKDDEDTGPVTVNMELDPAQFLSMAGGDDDDDIEDDDELEEGEFVEPSARINNTSQQQKKVTQPQPPNNAPQILNALGLRNVNPMSMLATDMMDDLEDGDEGSYLGLEGAPGAQCRLCAMKFSNRANARRHERNIHGMKHADGNESLTSGGTSTNLPSTPATPSTSTAVSLLNTTTTASSSTVKSVSTASRKSQDNREIYDYTNPQKYRHLLTEARLLFIKRNARFLHQYQDMTCKCCDRKYFTYKTFMAHMRKKYSTLPRNVCFNCLRKFDSKGQFIAHLKKRNCMNLFTLFMADETIPKDQRLLGQIGGGASGGLNTSGGVGEPRIGLKEMLSNKVYGCKICSEQLRLKNDFRAHISAAHAEMQGSRDPVTGACRHCGEALTDPHERKRHFSGMDCLQVIICTTCDRQFATNAKFLDHVYGTHLKELNAADERAAQLNTERLVEAAQAAQVAMVVKLEEQANGEMLKRQGQGQNNHQQLMPKKNSGCICPICNKQYNNYYNVLWHFESKHPEFVPKSYRCEICEEMFTKQALLKSHVQRDHGDVLQATNGPPSSPVKGNYKCRHCDECLSKASEYIAHQLQSHPEEELLTCHECEFVTEEREKLEEHLRVQHLNLPKLRVMSCGTCKQSFVTEDALKYHTMVNHAENESSEQTFKRMMKVAQLPEVERKEEPSSYSPADLDDHLADHHLDNGQENDNEDELLQDTSYLARVKLEESQRVRECPICVGEKFSVLSEFIQHMNGHVATDNVTNLDLEPGKSKSGAYHSRMRCRMCEKRISSKVGYKRHLLEEHGVDDCKIVQCNLCPGEFSNEKGLKVHLYRTHNICVKEDGEVVTMMPVLPPTTGESQLAVVAAQLAMQQKIKQETIEYECQICHTVYRSLTLLRSHVQSVHQMNDFEAYIQKYGNGEITTVTGGEEDTNTSQQQQQLDAMSLMMMTGLMDQPDQGDGDGSIGGGSTGGTDYTPIEVYFQCRYCDENFGSRQKLTAHMNTHEEHDPTDYTCRECGNVYQSRKSLWVHRNKKHPRSQVPSPCEVCKKVFFDKTELVYHLKTHVAQKMELMNELMSAAQNGDAMDDEEDLRESGAESEGEEGVKKYDCHVCQRKFRDTEKLSQHLRLHEMQNNMFVFGAFTEAGMDDEVGGSKGGNAALNGGQNEGGGDPFEPQFNEDGVEEYQCDMCPKKFAQLMALRVHRGWHYRSPDGRQITEPGQTWQPGSLRSQRNSKGGGVSNRNSTTGQQQQQTVTVAQVAATIVDLPLKKEAMQSLINNNNINNNNNANPKLPKCQFCSSTFASSNNLRRHIVEVHKRNDWRAPGQTGTSNSSHSAKSSSNAGAMGTGFVDKDRECQACAMTFETKAEWVEHKIGHARVMRPSTTFEWNCEMCGKVFTRKERLLQHMATHAQETGGMSTSGRVSGGESGSENSRGEMNADGEEEDGHDLDSDDDEPMVVNPDVEMLGDDDDDEDDDGEDDEEQEEGLVAVPVKEKNDKSVVLTQQENKNKSLCCDLCQLSFTEATELRKHVLSHFFNGQGTIGGDAAVKKKAVAGEEKVQSSQESNSQKSLIKHPLKEREEKTEEGPQAKKAKIDIPVEDEQEDDDDQFDEEEEDGEYVDQQKTLYKSTIGATGADETGQSLAVDPEEEGEGEDLDEGEYVEEYFDVDSFVSPKKPAVAANSSGPVKPPTTIVTGNLNAPATTATCRLCSSAYENNFKALKCMESHRQRSKYQCQQCELYFATPKQLGGHQQLVHGE